MHERGLLSEIGVMANRVRALRRDTVKNSAEIKILTVDMQAKWVELRVLRAPPPSDDAFMNRRQGHYD